MQNLVASASFLAPMGILNENINFKECFKLSKWKNEYCIKKLWAFEIYFSEIVPINRLNTLSEISLVSHKKCLAYFSYKFVFAQSEAFAK